MTNFTNLVGNKSAKELLERLVSHSTVPHVLLFHGPSGIGKGLFALNLARTLLQSNQEPHPDLHILHPDPESDQHPIAAIRQLIAETALPPFQAPCKIFIIHDIEKMLPTSSNALLKTLEEPPSDTRFILLTSNPSLLLPTILSRCSKVPFYPLSDEELTHFLQEKHIPDAQKIALLSEGSIAAALKKASHPQPLLPIPELLRAASYTEIHHLLSSLPDDLTTAETDALFEDILFHLRETDPLRLETALPLIQEARTALFHHLKFKNVLERLILKLLFS